MACGHHARLLLIYGQVSKKTIIPKANKHFSALTRCTGNMRPVCMVRKMFFYAGIQRPQHGNMRPAGCWFLRIGFLGNKKQYKGD